MWIQQVPPSGSTGIHHLDPPGSTKWIHQDPSRYAGTFSSKSLEIDELTKKSWNWKKRYAGTKSIFWFFKINLYTKVGKCIIKFESFLFIYLIDVKNRNFQKCSAGTKAIFWLFWNISVYRGLKLHFVFNSYQVWKILNTFLGYETTLQILE